MAEPAATSEERTSYSAGDVAYACEITADQLTNYISKARITLCSEAPGRGKSRKFATIDVYIIALLAELTKITRNQYWSARSLEYLVYASPSERRKTYPLSEMATMPHHRLQNSKNQYSEDFTKAHPLFSHRNYLEYSWLLFAEMWEIDANLFGLRCINSSEKADELKTIEVTFGINATWILGKIDIALARRVELRK